MFNKKLQTNFTIADNRIAQSSLSYEARGLYFYMLSLPNDWQFSEERLAKAGGIGIDKIKRILKELFAIGLLKREIIKDERGYNKAKYTLFDFDTLENPTLENPTLENPPTENPTLENPMYYKEIDSTKKNNNKEILNTNSANENFDFLSYAKQIFENSMTKPQITLELWTKYLQSKEIAVKRKRGKHIEITKRMVDNDFNALFKLQEIGIDVNDRVLEAIDMKYQSFWYDSDNLAWKKHGGHFKNNVGHLEYQSVSQNNPLAKIVKNLDDL